MDPSRSNIIVPEMASSGQLPEKDDQFGLGDLALELLQLMAQYLWPRDLLNLMLTSRDMYHRVIPVLYSQDAAENCVALRWACHYGAQPTLERCLQYGASADAYFPDGHIPEVQWNRFMRTNLVKRDRNLPYPPFGDFYDTPLITAIRRDHDDIVKILIDHGADVNKPDRTPIPRHGSLWYPIHWALSDHNSLFKRVDGHVNTLKNTHSSSFPTGHVAVLQHLIDAGARVNQLTTAMPSDDDAEDLGERLHPLKIAMSTVVPEEAVELLVRSGADPTIGSREGGRFRGEDQKPFDWILWSGPTVLNYKKARALLNHWNTTPKPQSQHPSLPPLNRDLTSRPLVPLLYDVVANWVPEPRWRPGAEIKVMVELLEAIHATDPSAIDHAVSQPQHPCLSQTALRLACTKDTSMDVTPIIRFLCRAGAHPSSGDRHGATALHYAVQWGNLDRVQELLAEAAALLDVNAADALGWTPLHYAAQFFDRHQTIEQSAIINELLGAGADARAVTAAGETVLHIACRAGNSAAVETLLAVLGPEDLGAMDGAERTAVGALAELVVLFTPHLDVELLDSLVHDVEQGGEGEMEVFVGPQQYGTYVAASENLGLHIRRSVGIIEGLLRKKMEGSGVEAEELNSDEPRSCYVVNTLGVSTAFFSATKLEDAVQGVQEGDMDQAFVGGVDLTARTGVMSVSRLVLRDSFYSGSRPSPDHVNYPRADTGTGRT